MQTTTITKPKVAAAAAAVAAAAVKMTDAMVSGRPYGGRAPRDAAALREWKSSEHVMLDTLASRPPRSFDALGDLPFARIETPGHSWILIHLCHIDSLGAAGLVSGYSHIVGSSAALEEDCDAPAVVGALEERTGARFDWNDGVRSMYDGLFEWDYAYDNFRRRAGPLAGEEHVLRPYDAAIAVRLAARWRQRP